MRGRNITVEYAVLLAMLVITIVMLVIVVSLLERSTQKENYEYYQRFECGGPTVHPE